MLETIYYATQILAVGLILGSLVAIYMQQRKDHALARAQTFRDMSNYAAEYFTHFISEPRTLESVRACLQDYVSATPQQQIDFTHLIHRAITQAEQALFMEQEKLLPSSTTQKHIGFPLSIVNTPGGRQSWEITKYAFSDEIRIRIDEQLRENEDKIPPVWEILPAFGADLAKKPSEAAEDS